MFEIKNVFLAIFLSLMVLVGWQYINDSMIKKTEKVTKVSNLKDIAQSDKSIAQSDKSIARALNVLTESNSNDIKIEIENENIVGYIDTRGLTFSEIVLKKYKNSINENSQNVTLFQKKYTKGKDALYADFGWVLQDQNEIIDNEINVLNKDLNKIDVPNNLTVWSVTSENKKLSPFSPVIFEHKNKQGVNFIMKISLDEDYLFTIERSVENKSGQPIYINDYSRIFKMIGSFKKASVAHEGVIGYFDNNKIEYNYEKLFKKGIINFDNAGNQTSDSQKSLNWIGFGDTYWFSALIKNKEDSYMVLKAKTVNSSLVSEGSESGASDDDAFNKQNNNNNYNKAQIAACSSKTIANNETSITSEYLFAGAKELLILDKYSKQLNISSFDHAVDFGVLYLITKPIFVLLQYLYKILGNFGLAIMALTVIIKLLLFPLSKKAIMSMDKLKSINPEMERIKEVYKDDKQKLNMEILNLFKKNKISPLSSIFPMIAQIPVFFALYKVLHISIEMRQAPFFGWIKDLSSKDPANLFKIFDYAGFNISSYLNIGILSIILGITMIIQQKFQPKVADQTQALFMKWMPYIFVIISASFPAGLIIYWCWNNLLTVGQQFIIEKFLVKPKQVSLSASLTR